VVKKWGKAKAKRRKKGKGVKEETLKFSSFLLNAEPEQKRQRTAGIAVHSLLPFSPFTS